MELIVYYVWGNTTGMEDLAIVQCLEQVTTQTITEYNNVDTVSLQL